MSDSSQAYEAVIGLEVHAQLRTVTKLFCGDRTSFGAEPNTQVSPITLAHPGTLPLMNRKAVEHAIRLGLVCHCDIRLDNYFARKNYFYPDLPKAYQISQHTTPICEGGWLDIHTGAAKRKVRLTRIHLEEDAGKSLHDQDPALTCLDFNRAGTPLVEIVTEPDIHSAEEAFAFLTEIRRLVRWIGVCDGNMEEGSLRCDANISIRPRGETKLGTRVEVKNLNSIRNVKKAIEVELARLIDMERRGEKRRPAALMRTTTAPSPSAARKTQMTTAISRTRTSPCSGSRRRISTGYAKAFRPCQKRSPRNGPPAWA